MIRRTAEQIQAEIKSWEELLAYTRMCQQPLGPCLKIIASLKNELIRTNGKKGSV